MKVDNKRFCDRIMDPVCGTGIFVRAQHEDGRWDSVDIADLTRESLIEFLSRDETTAMSVVLLLLDHEQEEESEK